MTHTSRTPAFRSKFRAELVLALLLTSASACVHNPSSTSATSPAQTSLQRVVIANAAVVKAVDAVEQAVEDAVTSNVLTAAKARPVITGCGRVMQTSIAVTAITSRGTEASWNVDGPKIRALLTASSLTIPASTSASIDLLIQTANSTIQLLISGVK